MTKLVPADAHEALPQPQAQSSPFARVWLKVDMSSALKEFTAVRGGCLALHQVLVKCWSALSQATCP